MTETKEKRSRGRPPKATQTIADRLAAKKRIESEIEGELEKFKAEIEEKESQAAKGKLILLDIAVWIKDFESRVGCSLPQFLHDINYKK